MTLQSARSEGNAPDDQLGKYRLVATLGQGGMGTVYLALARGLGQFRKLLVVKELRPDLTQMPGFVTMFIDEARLAARLEHPNVVQTFEVDHEADRYFLSMEYLDGQPLSALIERLNRPGGLPLWIHLQILSDVLAGLHYAHELKDYDGSPLHVVHRDVSPQNVFVTYHGQVKVVDFGVAKAADAKTSTDPGIFKGKFAYASPEQIMAQPTDARSDVFSVGIMLWQAISGRRFSAQLPSPAAFRARLDGNEPRIAEVVPDVNPILAAICDQALSVNPADRFASAAAFREDLQEYLEICETRVEAAHIGELMRSTFAAERREIHLVIEQAMKHMDASASLVASLPFLAADHEKAPTAVADLSSLIHVSHETDDEKIRQGYADSRITPLRPKPAPPAWWRSPQLTAAIAVAGAIGLALVFWLARGETRPSTTPLPPTAAAPSASSTNVASEPSEPSRPEPEPEPEPEPTSVAELDPIDGDRREHAVMRELADELDQPTKAARTDLVAQRERRALRAARHDTTRSVAPARDDRAEDPARPARPRPVENVDMGADLRTLKRGPSLSIDTEDPYR